MCRTRLVRIRRRISIAPPAAETVEEDFASDVPFLRNDVDALVTAMAAAKQGAVTAMGFELEESVAPFDV